MELGRVEAVRHHLDPIGRDRVEASQLGGGHGRCGEHGARPRAREVAPLECEQCNVPWHGEPRASRDVAERGADRPALSEPGAMHAADDGDVAGWALDAEADGDLEPLTGQNAARGATERDGAGHPWGSSTTDRHEVHAVHPVGVEAIAHEGDVVGRRKASGQLAHDRARRRLRGGIPGRRARPTGALRPSGLLGPVGPAFDGVDRRADPGRPPRVVRRVVRCGTRPRSGRGGHGRPRSASLARPPAAGDTPMRPQRRPAGTAGRDEPDPRSRDGHRQPRRPPARHRPWLRPRSGRRPRAASAPAGSMRRAARLRGRVDGPGSGSIRSDRPGGRGYATRCPATRVRRAAAPIHDRRGRPWPRPRSRPRCPSRARGAGRPARFPTQWISPRWWIPARARGSPGRAPAPLRRPRRRRSGSRPARRRDERRWRDRPSGSWSSGRDLHRSAAWRWPDTPAGGPRARRPARPRSCARAADRARGRWPHPARPRRRTWPG